MTQTQLLLLKRSKETKIAEVVDDKVTKMIDDGIRWIPHYLINIFSRILTAIFSLLIMKMNKTTDAFRNETNFIEPVERQWLIEEKVEKWFNYSDNASYETFLAYLRYLRDTEPLYWHSFQQLHSLSKVIEYNTTKSQYSNEDSVIYL